MSNNYNITNPWKDILSYKSSDAKFFKGRDADISKFQNILSNGTFSVLYSSSGIGKTSFLNAGIEPLMRHEKFVPIRIRFHWNDDAESEIIKTIEEETNMAGHTWQPTFSEWDLLKVEDKVKYQKICEQSLWWRLRTYKLIRQDDNEKIEYCPLLIFDQFEEVFRKEDVQISNFRKQLFQLFQSIYSYTLPVDIQKAMTLFYEQECYLTFPQQHLFKVIFALRKEFLSDFDYWTNERYRISDLLRNRMLLQPLTRMQAIEVITKQPLLDSEGYIVEGANTQTLDDVKDMILDKIDDKNNDEIEPLMLSVLCSRLYDEAISMGLESLMKQDVESIKLKSLISEFYSDIVTDVFNNTKLLSEFEEQMVDKKNHRNKVKSSLILNGKLDEVYKKILNDKTVNTSYKKELEDRHIIRVERYNGEDYVELIHDRIAEVISTRNDERRRRIANLKKYKSRQNILTLAGRRLMDNCGFDFSAGNSRIIVSGDSQSQLKNQILSSIHSREYDGSDNVFVADILNQIVGNNKLFLHFGGNPTKDGFEALGINTMLLNSQRIINGIVFYGSKESQVSTCSADGFNSINIDYDSEGREKRRIYNNSEDGVNVSGVTCYEIAKYDEDGFPLIILFKDENDKPCRHFDGNYGIEFLYDKFGNETYRRYLAEDGISSCKIYNQVCGLKSEYEESKDRVALQYFLDENGEITEDSYGIVGVKYFYNKNSGDLSSIEYIGKDLKTCMNPYGFSIVKFKYENGKRCQNRYYAIDGETLVNRVDGEYSYSILDIEYDKYDRIKEYKLRDIDGSLKLIILYTYDSIGRVTDTNYYVEKDFLGVNPSGVHHVNYEYYDNGLLRSQSHLGINGSYVEDTNGIHKAIFEWDEHGRLRKRHFYKSNQEKYNSQIFEYESDIWCLVKDITYIDSKGNCLVKPIEEKQKWIINHVFQAKEIIYGKDNDFIPGIPVRVKYSYNIAGDVIEYRFFDIGSEKSIPNENGDYGYQIETNKVKSLDENGKCSKNRHPYAIIVRNEIIYQGEECEEESYFDENNKAVLCELGYHRIVLGQPLSGNDYKIGPFLSVYDNELYRFAEFFDCDNNPCDCVDGYSKRQPQREQKNDAETTITVSFWGADGTRRINKELGFHKREQVISIDKGMEISRCFKDENDRLINVREGFAKQTCKLYDSLWNYFHYPFCDYKVIRFYDKDNKKVDVDWGVNKQKYHAYKYVISLDWSCLLKVKKASRQTLRRDLLRYLNAIWIPFYIVLLVVYPFLFLFKWLFHVLKPKNKVSLDYASIIRIEQVFDNVSNGRGSIVSPSKSIGLSDGNWIVRWNHWYYNKEDNEMAKRFKEEFSVPVEKKFITIYEPYTKKFFSMCLTGKNIGLRVQETQVPMSEVEDMIMRLKSELKNDIVKEKPISDTSIQ